MGGAKKSDAQYMSYARKIRKPIVEKQRRERMNKSISLLKTLIAQTIQQNTAPMTRVDKADILELTVYHLTQQQHSDNMATEVAAFSAGYKACAREAVTYLAKNKMTGDSVTCSLSNHLHTSFLVNSRRQDLSYQNDAGNNVFTQNRQTNRLSTPVRPCDKYKAPSLPEWNLSGYSPILNRTNTLPELTSSFIQANLDSSSSISSDFSSTSSIETTSSDNSSDHCKVDESISENDENDIDSCINVVTIGNGKENEIGHMIKEVPWRPI